MDLQEIIKVAVSKEVEKAVEEEVKAAESRLRERIAEIAARVPLQVLKHVDLSEQRTSYSVVIDHARMKQPV